MSTFLLPLLVLASQGALAQSTMAPNCVTGRMGFNAERMINYPATGMVNTGKIDPEKYDMTIDYGPGNVMVG